MSLNLSKTWEMIIHSKTKKEKPPLLRDIKRRGWLKLLGITFQENPCDWDMHIESVLKKASNHLYFIRVCKAYGYSKEQIDKLFKSLVVSVFLYGIEVWGAAYQRKHLDRIDNCFKRTRLLRKREHNYCFQGVNTERYKRAYKNRCRFPKSY